MYVTVCAVPSCGSCNGGVGGVTRASTVGVIVSRSHCSPPPPPPPLPPPPACLEPQPTWPRWLTCVACFTRFSVRFSTLFPIGAGVVIFRPSVAGSVFRRGRGPGPGWSVTVGVACLPGRGGRWPGWECPRLWRYRTGQGRNRQ